MSFHRNQPFRLSCNYRRCTLTTTFPLTIILASRIGVNKLLHEYRVSRQTFALCFPQLHFRTLISILCPEKAAEKWQKNQYRLRFFIFKTRWNFVHCVLLIIFVSKLFFPNAVLAETLKKLELALSSYKVFRCKKRADCGKPTKVIENSAWFHWVFLLCQQSRVET